VNVEALIRDLGDAAALPLTQARTLHPSCYTDRDYFNVEKSRVLNAGWLCAGHVSQLKETGAYLPVDFLDEPVLLLRGEDGEIHVFSRVCPHRGADILLDGEATGCGVFNSKITCGYHRWVFGLDGTLRAAPQMQKAEGFRPEDWRLARIRSTIWHGFIFVNLEGHAPPLEAIYSEFDKIIAPWNCQDLELVISMDWECRFNWKVMVENWIESYHHLGPHTKTLNPLMPAQDTWAELPNAAFIHAHLPLTGRDAAPLLEAIRQGVTGDGFLPLPGLDQMQQSEWNLFVGFPCFMLLLARDRAIWYRLQPLSAEHCRLTTTTLVSRASLTMPNYEKVLKAETRMLREFHNEDMAANQAVQRGLYSRHVVRGRLSHLEAPVWQFHRQLAEWMGAE
jgi:phenylpropionate dioxygenase-like ring-hydroxylating dioxygenase large terminal subunit